MYSYYLIRDDGKLHFVDATCLTSFLLCEVVGFFTSSIGFSLAQLSAFHDVLNSDDL